MVFPCASVMVIMVLLKVAFTCATPEAMFLRSRRRTRVASLPILDPLADLQHLLVGELRHAPGIRDSDFRHDFIGLFRPDPVDILQCNNDAFVGRYVDAGDAGHSYSLLLPAQA